MRRDQRQVRGRTGSVNGFLIRNFRCLKLFTVNTTATYTSIVTFIRVMKGNATDISSVLLLFVCLRLNTVMNVCFGAGRLPVQFLLCVTVATLAHCLVNSMSRRGTPSVNLLCLYNKVFFLTLSIITIQFTSCGFPSDGTVSTANRIVNRGCSRG